MIIGKGCRGDEERRASLRRPREVVLEETTPRCKRRGRFTGLERGNIDLEPDGGRKSRRKREVSRKQRPIRTLLSQAPRARARAARTSKKNNRRRRNDWQTAWSSSSRGARARRFQLGRRARGRMAALEEKRRRRGAKWNSRDDHRSATWFGHYDSRRCSKTPNGKEIRKAEGVQSDHEEYRDDATPGPRN